MQLRTRIWTAIRDWWRGYTDLDVMSLTAKLIKYKDADPGTAIPLSFAEHKALQARAQDVLP